MLEWAEKLKLCWLLPRKKRRKKSIRLNYYLLACSVIDVRPKKIFLVIFFTPESISWRLTFRNTTGAEKFESCDDVRFDVKERSKNTCRFFSWLFDRETAVQWCTFSWLITQKGKKIERKCSFSHEKRKWISEMHRSIGRVANLFLPHTSVSRSVLIKYFFYCSFLLFYPGKSRDWFPAESNLFFFFVHFRATRLPISLKRNI